MFRLSNGDTGEQDSAEAGMTREPRRAERLKRASPGARRSVRADAQRNLDALLEAAKAAFAASGVDAPVRDIATRAGVGIATV